jgi:hypothetical protein
VRVAQETKRLKSDVSYIPLKDLKHVTAEMKDKLGTAVAVTTTKQEREIALEYSNAPSLKDCRRPLKDRSKISLIKSVIITHSS